MLDLYLDACWYALFLAALNGVVLSLTNLPIALLFVCDESTTSAFRVKLLSGKNESVYPGVVGSMIMFGEYM